VTPALAVRTSFLTMDLTPQTARGGQRGIRDERFEPLDTAIERAYLAMRDVEIRQRKVPPIDNIHTA
jgi:hypothetical protein